MKLVLLISLTLQTFLISSLFAATDEMKIIYTSPSDNSSLVTTESNLIFKFQENIRDVAGHFRIKATGTKSGKISTELRITEEGRTLLCKPGKKFSEDEIVRVELYFVRQSRLQLLKSISFSTVPIELTYSERRNILYDIYRDEFGFDISNPNLHDNPMSDTLPKGFPGISVLTNSNPAKGRIYCATFERLQNNSYLIILDNNGIPVFYRHTPEPCYDFKMQPNGLMTYFQNIALKFYALDSSYNVTDSFYCGNGYETDLHDLIFKDNGNYLIMSYDPQRVNMSKIYPGGQKDANVVGLILQEIDPQNNVVFQWRSWDHFNILDGDSVNFSLGNIDYVHGNSIQIDYDGNYIISCRNMSEVTKINKETGEIIYRLGGKNNQFNFMNDSIKFSYQHAFRITPGGTYTLFDNGNFHTPKFSRVVEYRINEAERTAENVWEYRNDPSLYAFAMGYAERLANGNTTISWGFAPVSFTEVTPGKQKVYEMKFDSATFSYRVTRDDHSGDNQSIPPDYVITKSYPNPFNGFTTIYFSLPMDANVTIKVYDILGKEIHTLASNSFYQHGENKVTMNAEGLTSGAYFYKLTVNGADYTGKIMLVR